MSLFDVSIGMPKFAISIDVYTDPVPAKLKAVGKYTGVSAYLDPGVAVVHHAVDYLRSPGTFARGRLVRAAFRGVIRPPGISLASEERPENDPLRGSFTAVRTACWLLVFR